MFKVQIPYIQNVLNDNHLDELSATDDYEGGRPPGYDDNTIDRYVIDESTAAMLLGDQVADNTDQDHQYVIDEATAKLLLDDQGEEDQNRKQQQMQQTQQQHQHGTSSSSSSMLLKGDRSVYTSLLSAFTHHEQQQQLIQPSLLTTVNSMILSPRDMQDISVREDGEISSHTSDELNMSESPKHLCIDESAISVTVKKVATAAPSSTSGSSSNFIYLLYIYISLTLSSTDWSTAIGYLNGLRPGGYYFSFSI